MHKRKLLMLLGVMLCSLLFMGAAAHADAQAVDPVRFVTSTDTPGPNQEVRIEAQGVGGFLGDATITWRKDGEVVLSGPGERVLTFTTGALGSHTSVSVTITSESYGRISREFSFAPSSVNLIWEANTYTPLFFKGKALYTAGAPLKVIAYPSVIRGGSQVANGSLSFQWRRNGDAVSSASGLGRASFSFTGDQLQPEELIGVDIFLGSVKVGSGEILIPTYEPLVVLYNRDPLRGVVYEQAFPQFVTLAGKEITVQAEPYYFSTDSKRGGLLSYEWELNGQDATGPDAAEGMLTLRQEGSGAGESTLGVTVQNTDPDNLIQRASQAARIFFGGQTGSDSAFPGLGAAVGTFNRIAQNTVNPIYVPLEPLIPFEGDLRQNDQFTQYLVTVFRLLIIGGALFAVLMLTIGGVTYMVSEVPGVKLDALDRAKSALLGILIIGSSWLILNTINPNLLNFKLILERTNAVREAPPEWNPSDSAPGQEINSGQAQRVEVNLGKTSPFKEVKDALYFNGEPSKEEINAFKKNCSNIEGGNSFAANTNLIEKTSGVLMVCAVK